MPIWVGGVQVKIHSEKNCNWNTLHKSKSATLLMTSAAFSITMKRWVYFNMDI